MFKKKKKKKKGQWHMPSFLLSDYILQYTVYVWHFIHYENIPIQIYWKFYHQKMEIFR